MRDQSIWYTRKNIPIELKDSDAWPRLDESELSVESKDWIRSRRSAIRAYLRGDSLRGVSREFGVTAAEILRHLNRCLQPHTDGRNLGWRALVPYRPVKAYTRVARPSKGSGMAGAFTQFLEDRVELREQLLCAVSGEFEDALPESRAAHRALYSKFKRLCRHFNVSQTQYPFSCKDEGRRSLRRYAIDVLRSHFAEGARRLGGDDARVRSEVGTSLQTSRECNEYFDTASTDAHLLPFIGSIAIPTHKRVEIVPLRRCHVLPILEHESRAVLGYSICIARQPSAQHVVAAVKNALGPWRPRTLTLPGFRYPPGAMMPSAMAGAEGLCWSTLLMDNATIHYSNAVAERIRRATGSAICWGSVGKWYARPLIEALFSSLERAGFERLPNSMGRGPEDPLRQDAVSNAVKHVMDIEELLDLVDVCFCTYNGTPQEHIDNLSPLQRIRLALDHRSSAWLPRRLPPRPRSIPELDVEVIPKFIRGNQKKGRRPYIQIEHVRYTSPVLARSAKLIGKCLRVHVRWSDLRNVLAFFESGEELGVLTALGGWSRTPHDLNMRRAIVAAMHDKSLVVPPDTDPIQEYLVLKAKQAVQRKADRHRKKDVVSDEATELARATQITGLAVPVVSTTPASVPVPDAVMPAARTPSFVPRIAHKGRLT